MSCLNNVGPPGFEPGSDGFFKIAGAIHFWLIFCLLKNCHYTTAPSYSLLNRHFSFYKTYQKHIHYPKEFAIILGILSISESAKM